MDPSSWIRITDLAEGFGSRVACPPRLKQTKYGTEVALLVDVLLPKLGKRGAAVLPKLGKRGAAVLPELREK